MTTTEKINLGMLFAAIAGGIFFLGDLNGRVRTLERLDIQAQLDQALNSLAQAAERFRNLGETDTETFEWQWQQQPREMIRKSEGICYLVYVTGRFEGGGEAVEIVDLGDTWYLQGRQGDAGAQIGASATCWKFPSLDETLNPVSTTDTLPISE